MIDRKKLTVSVMGLSILAGLTGGAVAASHSTPATAASVSEASELEAIQSARLSIADAARAAETETGGRAVDVSLEDDNGQLAYEVEIATSDGTIVEVLVDAQSGKVVNASADSEDEDDYGGADEEDEENESEEKGEND